MKLACICRPPTAAITGALLFAFLLATPATTFAIPINNHCTPGTTGGLAPVATNFCYFAELNSDGQPSDIGAIVDLGGSFGAGNIFILNFGVDASVVANRTLPNVSDVLVFINNGSFIATTAQLRSRGCNTPATPTACFPGFGAGGLADVFISEAIDGSFSYKPDSNHTYAGISDDLPGGGGGTTPEPATMTLAGAALLALIAKHRLQG